MEESKFDGKRSEQDTGFSSESLSGLGLDSAYLRFR